MKNITVILALVALIFSGCNRDDDDVKNPPINNEEELITTVQLEFTPASGITVTSVFSWRDVDGLGGNAPNIDTIKLNPNTTYNVRVILLNESSNPVDTISKEVEEEANDHLFVYTPSSSSITTTIVDYDTNTPALPLGLESIWAVTSSGNYSIMISLKHQPGIKNGDPNLGETDIEVTMPIVIQ